MARMQSELMRTFFGAGRRVRGGSALAPGVVVDDGSSVDACRLGAGSVIKKSLLANVVTEVRL